MMLEEQNWSQRRRARNQSQSDTDEAVSLCTRYLRSGAVAEASRSALLAHRLVRLEAALADRQKKREFKVAMERHRAEAALAEARKAVASIAKPPPPKSTYDVNCADGEWPDMLKGMIAEAEAQRRADNPTLDSQPDRNPASDSC